MVDQNPSPNEPIRLAASRCPRCGRYEFPRREHCPACLAEAEPAALGPAATVGGFTSVLHAPPGAKVDVPYHVGVARFQEGLSVLGLLTDSGGLHLGDSLQVVAVPFDADRLTYGFRPADRLPGGAR